MPATGDTSPAQVPLAKSAEWVRVHMRVCPSERIGKIKLKRGEQNGATVPLWLCPVKGTSAPLMPRSRHVVRAASQPPSP